MARQVRVEILADARKFTRGMQDAQRSTQKFSDHTNRAGTALKAAFATFSAGVVVHEIGKYVAAARDSNRVTAQINAVIKSTRGAAGLSAKGFDDLAKSIEKSTAVDDDLIAGGEAIIATFTNIHGDVFKKTTRAAVDLAAGMNHGAVTAEGLQAASIQLGKALQDPIKGVTSLQRIGIKLNDQQKQQIATFVKNGQTAKAQGIILAEVNRQFAGSAAAAVTPAKRLAQQWGDMQEVLGNLLIPAIDKGAVILSSILGVVDRNRKAFGILFGVVGTGAAIIGTLIVAEKIHKAVTEGVEVATKLWSGTQKGLNTVLGLTRVQAASTAVAEDALAASTTAAGTAAKGAAVSGGGLVAGLSKLLPVVGLAVVGFQQYKKTTEEVAGLTGKARQQAELGIGPHRQLGLTVAQAAEAWRKESGATKDAGKATGETVVAAVAAGVAVKDLTGKTDTQARSMVDNAAKAKELSGKLSSLKDQWKQQVGAVKDAILSYDGLISQSKVTAGQVVKDLNTQVRNFQTYSTDVHRLIKAGVSPAAIQELSQKGPQFVHALARGTNRELETYKSYWADRQREVKTRFAGSMQEQLADLVKKIKAMNREIQRLKGKTVDVTASTKVDPNVLKVFTAAGGRVRMSQKGDRVPGYGGGDRHPYLLEGGETVVSKEHSRMPQMVAAFKAAGVPGYAAGGRVYSAELGMRDRASGLMVGSASRAAKLYQQLGTGGSADVNSVAKWTAAILGRAGEWAAWARRIMFESGGRWNAVNRTDSNWFAGHPSVGGAQVIRGTFAANAGPYRGIGPFLYGVSINPRANSYAGGHYAIGRYGSLAAVDPRVRPMGYDRGGNLPPGLSVAWNGTGRPEPVGAGGITINFNGPVYGDERAMIPKIRQGIREALRAEGKPVTV